MYIYYLVERILKCKTFRWHLFSLLQSLKLFFTESDFLCAKNHKIRTRTGSARNAGPVKAGSVVWCHAVFVYFLRYQSEGLGVQIRISSFQLCTIPFEKVQKVQKKVRKVQKVQKKSAKSRKKSKKSRKSPKSPEKWCEPNSSVRWHELYWFKNSVH
jgi:hypothetical protein